MKRIAIVAALLTTLALAPTAQAQEDNWTFHIGIGGDYAIEHLDMAKTNSLLTSNGVASIALDNAFGVNAKLGFLYQRIIGVEFNFDYLSSFQGEYFDYLGRKDFDMELSVRTFLLDVKFAPDFGSESIRPYVFAGFGLMQGEIKVTEYVHIWTNSVNDSESGLATEFGLGLDYYFNDRFSLGGEGAYVMGLDKMDGINYFNFTIGTAIHF